jgi:hypothetical protein
MTKFSHWQGNIDINVHHSVSGGDGGTHGRYPPSVLASTFPSIIHMAPIHHTHLTEEASSVIALGT